MRCDVRDRDAVDQFVLETKQRLGGVHFLINNAGIASDGALWRLSVEAWQEVLDTNVTGAFNCIRAVAPDRSAAQHYGKIVSVSAHQAERPGFGVANYAASKAALLGLTRAAAVELGPANVNVNAVAPGFIRTERMAMLPVGGHRAGAEELGPRPRGGAGRRGARDLVPVLGVGAAHHGADDRGGWGAVAGVARSAGGDAWSRTARHLSDPVIPSAARDLGRMQFDRCPLYVYILSSQTRVLYTGSTSDLASADVPARGTDSFRLHPAVSRRRTSSTFECHASTRSGVELRARDQGLAARRRSSP